MKLKHITLTQKNPSTVVCAGRYGLVSRRRVVPANPRTQRQSEVRRNLAEQARRFGDLTDAQREAWNAAAATYRSHPRQGQSGPLTGLHLFIRVNCKLALFGLEPLNTSPPPPVFPDLAPQELVITNRGGVVAVKLVCAADPGGNTVLRASPPQSAGVGICRVFRIIGMCPAPVAGLVDITALYSACFGPPPVGRRIFLRASTMVSGFESLPREFRARVPACVAEASSSPKPWPTPARPKARAVTADIQALSDTKVARVCGDRLCALYRHRRLHDHPLVLGFRGRGVHRHGHRGRGRKELLAESNVTTPFPHLLPVQGQPVFSRDDPPWRLTSTGIQLSRPCSALGLKGFTYSILLR